MAVSEGERGMLNRTSAGSCPRRGSTVLAVVAAVSAFLVSTMVSAAPAGGALVVGATTAAPAAVVPVPAVNGPIAVTGDSYPFNSASRQVVPVDLAEFGYVEEEYFLSGSANVYEWDELFETVGVRTPDAPYTNRILVRRPSNPRKFSGSVIVELFNPTGGGLGYEAPWIWADSWQYMVDRGHIWIGVTAAPSALQALKTFDPARYAPLAWNDPLPPEERCDPTRTTEDGLLWDILSQVGALVKSDDPSNPLRRYEVEHAYATGQLGGGWSLYTNTIGPIAKTAAGEPVYDGYVIKASGTHAGAINQCAPVPESTHPMAKSRSPQPVIRLHSHSDVLRGSATHAGSVCDIRRPDSDDVLPYRHYEIAGLLVNARNQVTGAPGPADGARAGGIPIPVEGVLPLPANEFPFRYIMNGAFENMDRWVRDGIPPPRATFLEEATPDCRSLSVDRFGTPLGGVRTPYVDVPINTYPPEELPAIAFPSELVRELSGTHGNYVRQVIARTDELIEDRWVTRDDGQRIKTEAAHSLVLNGG